MTAAFESMALTRAAGNSALTGHGRDQAEDQGFPQCASDLGLTPLDAKAIDDSLQELPCNGPANARTAGSTSPASRRHETGADEGTATQEVKKGRTIELNWKRCSSRRFCARGRAPFPVARRSRHVERFQALFRTRGSAHGFLPVRGDFVGLGAAAHVRSAAHPTPAEHQPPTQTAAVSPALRPLASWESGVKRPLDAARIEIGRLS
jgi:hypothetical protein